MPRGETNETPEVPQEELNESSEINEQEVKRDQEVVAEPEAVVERERPVQESEEIEREVIEAVEAVEKDGGPRSDEVSATPITLPDPPGDEVSATPITLPDPPGDEVSATPITLPDPPRDQGDEISATPITLPDPPKDQGEDISATPITLPDPPRDEISAPPRTEERENISVLDEASFKVESPSPDWDEDPPRPPQGTMEMGRSETEGGEEFRAEDEDVILDEDSFKPVPAQEGRELSPNDVKLKDGVPETGDREQTPTEPIFEKDLPEGGQLQEGMDQREDLQGIMDKDLDSLFPDEGEIVGADGKKVGGSKLGDDVSGIPGMGSGGKIDGSSEDPSGDQFAGKGMFKPGKGPGGGAVEGDVPGANPSSTWTKTERDVYRFVKTSSEKDVGVTEEIIQEQALDDYEITQAILSTDEEEEEKLRKKYGGSKSETSRMESTPDGEEGGSEVHAVSQEEFDAVVDKVDGGQISNQDPDQQSGEVPDRLTAEGAKKVKDALDKAASTKHKQKKAGAELITDPDKEDPEGGDIGKKENL